MCICVNISCGTIPCMNDNTSNNNMMIINTDSASGTNNTTDRSQIILAIFYPPLKYLGGCCWLFYRLRRETSISQNWLKG